MRYTVAIATLLLFVCEPSRSLQGETMKIESSSFMQGQPIPQKYTCDGGDVSPQLRWSNAPEGTKTFAVIADDPDAPAGTWVHWVIYNIPGDKHELPEGVEKTAATPVGEQGVNDFRKVGYSGPCPPPGKAYRYFFKLYGLDTQLRLKSGTTKKDLEAAMQGHILANAELMGTCQRRGR
jgi:hypothetical protein